MTYRAYWLMLLPALLGVMALEILPALLTVSLAFTHYDALSAPTWAGLGNFAQLSRDRIFGIALSNTLHFLAWSAPLRFAVSLIAALLLENDKRGLSLLRGANLAPSLMPEAAYSLAWLWIVNPIYGPVNHILAALGLPASGWLADPAAAADVFILMSVFQAGESFLIILAALRSVPPSLHDAAQIDGAGYWTRYRLVILPTILPWLGAALLRDSVLLMFYTLAPTRLMTGGDPSYATLFLPLYSFQQSIEYLRIGYGAASTVVIWVLALLPGLLSVRWLWTRMDE
ncbi:MAG: sugar ABC transporter permease [Anaerolineae bacterium]|nr:sugar ABC transporter permease [Anaerolineae bacterium]